MAKIKFNLKRRLIPLLIVSVIVFSLFSISAFAMEKTEGENNAVPTDSTLPVFSEGDTTLGTEGETPANTDKGEDLTDGTEKVGTDDGTEGEGVFITALFSDFKNYLPEILSALSFICSVILMIVYKSGFIPMVKEGVTALSARVKAIGEEADKMTSDAKNTDEIIKATLAGGEEKLAAMERAISSLAEKLYGIESLGIKSESLAKALSLEVEMLYELFMSSSLPQYEKNRVGEKIAEMRRLSDGGGE